MSIDENFIDKIVSLARKDGVVEIDGVKYTNNKMYKVPVLTPDSISVHSLSGLVDYFGASISDKQEVIFHVQDEGNVRLISSIDDDTKEREKYINSSLIGDNFQFGRYHPIEEFIVAMQSQFVREPIVDDILSVIGNITQEAEHKTLDDGVSQTVTAKTGLVTVDNVKVPNPVTLRPFRTFSEIEQPASMFIFRMKKGNDGPVCALFEADGGAWKETAVDSIKEYLTENTDSKVPVIG